MLIHAPQGRRLPTPVTYIDYAATGGTIDRPFAR